MKTNPPEMLFDPRRLTLCIRSVDGVVHTLRPEAPDAAPWTSCRTPLDPGARLILRLGGEAAVYTDLEGFKIEDPVLCGECLPHTDAQRAKSLGDRLRLFAWPEEDCETMRRHLEQGTLPESREGRFGMIAITLEALQKLREYVDGGAYPADEYDAVVAQILTPDAADGEEEKGEGASR